MANRKHDDLDFTIENLSILLGRHPSSITRYINKRWIDEPEYKQCTLYLIWYLKNTVRKYNMNLVYRNNPIFSDERMAELRKNKPYLDIKKK